MNLLLCFSGQIGSGKSSVSTAVACALGWRRGGFGDYLRGELTRMGGNPDDRKALQDLGQARVASDPVAFCSDVLTSSGFLPGDNFVIDGIRHVGIFDILAKICKPTQARLLFLGALEATRITRIAARADSQDFERASNHEVEAELREALPQRADGLIGADGPLDRIVADCLDMVWRWRKDQP